ncbi:MtrB/PioB family decaheme-associated outer membrane protein [Blastochloris tepida]|uniref:Outer membrane protein n=1 Tax=Blastochloris tepida TaxID=2233851 RepID=A0A348FYM4_9HYPH|nr:MtrB/PioB family decaheme-associated outer membrane protein [Blastochloris tepida]BBF92407.1 hypothetical protein BLTE_10920 [Blastochloris tepida]
MKVNGRTALTGVLLMAAGSALSSGAAAQQPATQQPKVATPEDFWNQTWAEHGGVRTWGNVEAGFRAFIERPPSYALPGILPAGRPTAAGTNTNPLQGGQPAPIFNTDRDNRAKFEEYGNISPGFFFETLILGAQTKDGMYAGELRADNVGNNNQRFIFDWSKAGEIYGTYSWDQIPHLYSASAQSIWNGVGTDYLTTPVYIGNIANSGLASNTAVYNALQGNLNTIDIGIQRDKFAAMQRWTPTENWDFRADYSHEHREGTQIAGAVIGGMANQQMVQLPAPVSDTTQNAKLAGQYAGDTPWGGKFNVRTSASVSAYQNDFDSYVFQNPFYAGDGATLAARANYSPFGRVSLAPDNQAYNFGATAGIDLPNKSRYMGTVSYTMMRQDDPFIPYTINPNVETYALPASSADAKVDTLLINNVLNTPLSRDVKSTLRYRYYDNNNTTPELLFPNFVVEDSSNTACPAPNAALRCAAGSARRNLAYSYTKQNASEELTWRADKNLTLGGSIGWEQYDRDRRAVDVTNEFIGRVYMNATIAEETRLRASYQYSQRNYDNYDFMGVASYIYWANQTTGVNVTNMMVRQLDLADRERQKANVSLEYTGVENLTVTPTFGLRFDAYETNPYETDPNYIATATGGGNPNNGTALAIPGQLGITKDNTWNAGIEVAYQISPAATIMFAYVYENFDRDLYGGQGTTNFVTLTTNNGRFFFSNMEENVNTYIATANLDIIPDTLELKLSYAYAQGEENWTAQPYTNSSDCLALINSACQPFPTVKTDYQRFDAIMKYHVDPDLVTKVGLIGDVILKLRYSFEQTQVKNWQNDWTTPYMYLVDGSMVRNISMAAVDPNYTSHLIAASLAVKW